MFTPELSAYLRLARHNRLIMMEIQAAALNFLPRSGLCRNELIISIISNMHSSTVQNTVMTQLKQHGMSLLIIIVCGISISRAAYVQSWFGLPMYRAGMSCLCTELEWAAYVQRWFGLPMYRAGLGCLCTELE